jgi:cytochrome c5
MRPIAILAVLAVIGCGGPGPDPDAGSPSLADAKPEPAELLRLWSTSCALCHVNGEGGAPRMGVAAEWQARLAKGREVLLTHTIEGFNNMPPLGYCMSCSRDDFDRLITFMAPPQ